MSHPRPTRVRAPVYRGYPQDDGSSQRQLVRVSCASRRGRMLVRRATCTRQIVRNRHWIVSKKKQKMFGIVKFNYVFQPCDVTFQFGEIVPTSYDEYTALVKSGNVASKHVNGWRVRSKRQI